MTSRRKFLSLTGTIAAAGAAIGMTRAATAQAQGGHEGHGATTQPLQRPAREVQMTTGAAPAARTVVPPTPADNSYRPVVTLNGNSLPWRMNGGVKEFRLMAQPVKREFAPGMVVNAWGYNGQTPGPTIEAVEGDRVRIYVKNELPEWTTVHWHGILLAERHGRRRRADPAANPARQDRRLRVHPRAFRHLHVSPARRRDGADGDGHDGHIHHPSARARASTVSIATSQSCCTVGREAGHGDAADRDDARFQHVDVQQPGLPGHRSLAGPARRARPYPRSPTSA